MEEVFHFPNVGGFQLVASSSQGNYCRRILSFCVECSTSSSVQEISPIIWIEAPQSATYARIFCAQNFFEMSGRGVAVLTEHILLGEDFFTDSHAAADSSKSLHLRILPKSFPGWGPCQSCFFFLGCLADDSKSWFLSRLRAVKSAHCGELYFVPVIAIFVTLCKTDRDESHRAPARVGLRNESLRACSSLGRRCKLPQDKDNEGRQEDNGWKECGGWSRS